MPDTTTTFGEEVLSTISSVSDQPKHWTAVHQLWWSLCNGAYIDTTGASWKTSATRLISGSINIVKTTEGLMRGLWCVSAAGYKEINSYRGVAHRFILNLRDQLKTEAKDPKSHVYQKSKKALLHRSLLMATRAYAWPAEVYQTTKRTMPTGIMFAKTGVLTAAAAIFALSSYSSATEAAASKNFQSCFERTLQDVVESSEETIARGEALGLNYDYQLRNVATAYCSAADSPLTSMMAGRELGEWERNERERLDALEATMRARMPQPSIDDAFCSDPDNLPQCTAWFERVTASEQPLKATTYCTEDENAAECSVWRSKQGERLDRDYAARRRALHPIRPPVPESIPDAVVTAEEPHPAS